MNQRVHKAIIAKNLENWYSIDSILFNEHAKYTIKDGSVFQEYCALKATLLSNLFEYWNHISYTPVNPTIPEHVEEVKNIGVSEAKKAKTLASKIIATETAKAKIKKEILEEVKKRNISDIGEFQDKMIHEKFLQISLHNCLVGMPLLESKNPDIKCDSKCKILENTHRLILNNLVKMSLVCEKVSK